VSAVVEVITALERGGAQRVVLETAARLHRPERPVLVITGRAADLDAEAQRRLPGRVIHVPSLQGPVALGADGRALFELHRALAHIRDRFGGRIVVHTHSSKAGVLGRLAGRALEGVHTVHTVHGFGFDAVDAKKRWVLTAAERVAASASDAILFVSNSDRELALREGYAGNAAVHMIRDAIDTAPFSSLRTAEARARGRARFGIADDVPLAVTVGNLKKQKDPVFHVEVLAAWRKRVPNAELLFVGDGPLRAQVEARARALGVSGALHLPGFVPDARDVLAAGDVYLLASLWEGLPCSLLEAIASGLFAVVRDTGYGVDLDWANGIADRLPLDASPEAFADGLVDLLARKAAGAPHRALPPEFTFDGMLARLDRIYDGLLAS
jgi:glycosyltransferase involved in cell wall biosynthesis